MDYAVARCLPVCPCVRPSVGLLHAVILSKRLYISSKFFHRRVGTPFYFPIPNGMAILRRGPPLTGRRIQAGYEQEAQLSQRNLATLLVIEYFAKSLKVIRNDTVELKLCLCVVPFLRYSASKNGVTLTLG